MFNGNGNGIRSVPLPHRFDGFKFDEGEDNKEIGLRRGHLFRQAKLLIQTIGGVLTSSMYEFSSYVEQDMLTWEREITQLSHIIFSNRFEKGRFEFLGHSSVNKKESPISLLPRDALAYIFSRLNIRDQLNFRRVCKKWNHVPSFYHHFEKKRWRPHRIALHLRGVPAFTKPLSRIRLFYKIKKSAKAVATFVAANLASGQFARWAIKYSASLNKAFDQLPFEHVKELTEAYNQSNVCYWVSRFDDGDWVCRPRRLPEEMVTIESFIKLTKDNNNDTKKFFCYFVVPLVAITTTAIILPKVRKIWKSKDIEVNKRFTMEELKRTLERSLRLSSQNI